MNRSDIIEICQEVAAQYPGWYYHAHEFKYKKLEHSEIRIDPSWVLHLSAEPQVEIYNKSVNKAMKESFKGFKPAKLDLPYVDLGTQCPQQCYDLSKIGSYAAGCGSLYCRFF